MADSVIVGNFLGKESLAAVGFSYQINFLLIALSTGISLGASVLVSRYFGARDMRQVKKVVDTGFLFSAVLSLVIAAAGACFSYQILVLFRVPENLLTIADTYLKIIFIGVIPTFAYNSLTNILRGVGDSKTPTYILIAATLINIVLDIFFITALKWGVAGAAVATVTAQAFSFITCMLYMRRRYPDLFIRLWDLQLDRHELKKSLVIGTPAMLQQVFVSVGFMSIQFLINGFGTDCMAAYAAASKVDSFAEMPALNLGQAMTNFTVTMQILNGLLLGYGKALVPMIASIGSLCLLQVPTAILLSGTELAYRGIWIAAPVGWLGGLLIRFLYFRYIARKQAALKEA